jgi:antitoxin MazE
MYILMPNSLTIAKWGNSLAIRIPLPLAREAGLAEGDQVSVGLTKDGDLILRTPRPKYSLDELVSQIKPGNRHSETDWGAAHGNELW